jgi:Fic family protein
MKNYPHIMFTKNWILGADVLYMMGQCDCIVQAIASMPIKPEYKNMLLSVSLRKGARATTAIEGNTLSEEEIEKIQQGRKLPPSKEYLQVEVQNIIDALNKIGTEVLEEGQSAIITPQMIKTFNLYVGKNLGEHFQAIPGQFRNHNVIVGTYRAPEGVDVPALVEELCNWLRDIFKYEDGSQGFMDQVIQAIITHVYIAMIHPFGDGNGRTARLMEFYILLRAGLPNIASHILSNHYNDTRQEYYRQLGQCVKTRDLTNFIKYAVTGFRDGLNGVLSLVQESQLITAWHNYIYETLDSKKASGKTRAVVKRRRTLALKLPVEGKGLTIKYLLENDPILMREYKDLTEATIVRDLSELKRLDLVTESGNLYRGKIEIMKMHMPKRKE